MFHDNKNNLDYIKTFNRQYDILINNKRFFFIHGDIIDTWLGITENIINIDSYKLYDYVLSGHTHRQHLFQKNIENKIVTFLNPGSVGQPRNHNKNAQYTHIDTNNLSINFNSVEYNIYEETKQLNSYNPSLTKLAILS